MCISETPFLGPMFGDQQDDLLAELLQGVSGPDWLDSLNQDLQATQIDEFGIESAHSGTLKRSTSSPLRFQTPGLSSSTPLAMNPNVALRNEEISSYESNQSFLDSFGFNGLEENRLSRRESAKNVNGMPPVMPSGKPVLPRPNSMPSVMPTHTVPAQGGHWAWVPEEGSNGMPSVPPPSHPPAHESYQVPVKTGRLPLTMSAHDTDIDLLNLDITESFDVLEMANTLVLEQGSGGIQRIHGKGHGSCPLPVLLEDSISDPTLDNDSLSPQTSIDNSGCTGMITSQGSGRIRARPSGAIPMNHAREIPMKSQRSSRSQSSPHLGSGLLASSCPTYGGSARSPYMGSGSLSDINDDLDPDYSVEMGRAHSLRSSGGTSSSKKKHNPWSVEETVALINGVHQTGIGKWAEIKRLKDPEISDVLSSRSAVDLKDKWRNLTRVAKLPKATLKAKLSKERGQGEIPLESMLLVKELMESMDK